MDGAAISTLMKRSAGEMKSKGEASVTSSGGVILGGGVVSGAGLVKSLGVVMSDGVNAVLFSGMRSLGRVVLALSHQNSSTLSV